MFSGIVETLGTVARIEDDGMGGKNLAIAIDFAAQLGIGDSIAINGTCLTVVSRDADAFLVQAGPETLVRTNLGELAVGSRVNLERSLCLGDRLGGHIVSGHIDGVGRIAERVVSGEWETVWFTVPPELAAQMVTKGSVAVDGVSLTLVDVLPDRFSVALIPHTLAVTTLGFKTAGDPVNIETDMLGKFVLKYLQGLNLGPLPPRRPGEPDSR